MASGVIGITDDEVPVVLIGNMQALCHAVLVHLEASRFYHSGPGINAYKYTAQQPLGTHTAAKGMLHPCSKQPQVHACSHDLHACSHQFQLTCSVVMSSYHCNQPTAQVGASITSLHAPL
jgi:hypothetical protein